MHLQSFRVRKFRNVLDSSDVRVEPDVTCLVGKNEAGKSALLEALYLLNPVYGETFHIEEQYPNWLLAADRRAGDPLEVTPVEATFELSPADVAAVEAALGAGVLAAERITVGRRYDGGTEWAVALDDSAAAAGGEEPWRAAVGVLEERLPQFFRFTEYHRLPGTVALRDLERDVEPPGASGLQTARALLRLADSDPRDLRTDDFELRRGELDAVQISLTREVFEYWRQNTDLEVHFDTQQRTERATLGGPQSVVDELHIRLHDRRTGYSSNFSQRSSGFQWFFSFLAAFSEFRDAPSDVVVLLDEPALTLHGAAQADLLRFIDERLAPASPVLYTTHSPFLLDPGRLERVRLVEDRGPSEGAVAGDDLVSADAEGLRPLRAALGFAMARDLFAGPRHLVVETPVEYVVLEALSTRLRKAGRAHLDGRWQVLPAGTAAHLPTAVSLIGPAAGVTVLTGEDAPGLRRVSGSLARLLLSGEHVVTFGDALGGEVEHAGVEDLFTPEDYLALHNAATRSKLQLRMLPSGASITERISAATGAVDRAAVAQHLATGRRVKLSPTTLDAFERLFERINATLPADGA
jgi:predicted ATPase